MFWGPGLFLNVKFMSWILLLEPQIELPYNSFCGVTKIPWILFRYLFPVQLPKVQQNYLCSFGVYLANKCTSFIVSSSFISHVLSTDTDEPTAVRVKGRTQSPR